LQLISMSAQLGHYLVKALSEIKSSGSCFCHARGLGLVAGLELRLPNGSTATALAFRVVKSMLQRGFVLLPDGEDANVIEFTPPLTINHRQLRGAVQALSEVLTTTQ
jgi:4-aminobutyrate aminotransferase-like enzyme